MEPLEKRHTEDAAIHYHSLSGKRIMGKYTNLVVLRAKIKCQISYTFI